MDIYAPLAERIGMYEFMTEMQTLAFRELEPDAYESITKRLERLHKAAAATSSSASAAASRRHLEANGIEAEVKGREKHPYSIWRKMAERHVSFEQLSDVMAFRAIVGTVEECYRTLGLIHQRWPVVPGRFKDFISTPKRNGYRSIHTTIIHDEQMRIEIQIRTREMHAQAEHGLAAHWAYKEGEPTADLGPSLDQRPGRDPRPCRQRRGAARAYPHGDVPGPDLRLHPEGRADPAAQGRDPGRFRLCGPHRSRRPDGRREDQRPGDAAAHPARQWRPGRDPGLQGAASAAGAGSLRRHRQGAREDPPLGESKEREETVALGRKIFDEIVQRLPAPLGWEAIAEALKPPASANDEALMEAIALKRSTTSR